MRWLSHGRMWGMLVMLVGLAASPRTQADALSAVQVLREGGCGGVVPIAGDLRHSVTLDHAAAQWAAGRPLPQVATAGGYSSAALAGVHVAGSESTLLQQLIRSDCRALSNPGLQEVGAFHRGADTWLVAASGTGAVAAGVTVPTRSPQQPVPKVQATAPTIVLSTRALELVNEVRARGTRCGARAFAPAPPITLSGTLGTVAFGHAADMATHGYFEHQDLAGQSPADRVRAVGYREKLVGENIAYGPETVDEVVKGWLDSPGHCENIMDPRFAEMGVAFAAGRGAKHGLYWVQVLAEPRA
jgi:uncharacterized protein YkwD